MLVYVKIYKENLSRFVSIIPIYLNHLKPNETACCAHHVTLPYLTLCLVGQK